MYYSYEAVQRKFHAGQSHRFLEFAGRRVRIRGRINRWRRDDRHNSAAMTSAKERIMSETILRPERATIPAWYLRWSVILVLSVIGPILGIAFIQDKEGVTAMWVLLGCVILPAIPTFFWIPFFWGTLRYTVRDDAVQSSGGVFFRKRITVPYTKVTNVDIYQGPIERMFGVGRLGIQTAGMSGQSGSELIIQGIRDLTATRDLIYAKVRHHQMSADGETAGGSLNAAESKLLRMIHRELSQIRELLGER